MEKKSTVRRVMRVEFLKPVWIPGEQAPQRVRADDPSMRYEAGCIVIGKRRYPLSVVEHFDLED